MKTLSLRARLTIWYVLVLVIVLITFAAGVLVVQQRIGLQRIDRDLAAAHAQLANVLGEELRELDAPDLAARESSAIVASAGRAVAILDADGGVLAATADTVNLAGRLAGGPIANGITTLEVPDGRWRLHVEREMVAGKSMLLAVASPLTALGRDQRELREAIAIGIPIALLLAGAGGLWLASIGLGPITNMARRAASLSPTGLEDLGEPVRADELGQLTAAFNGLVARLRAALRTQQQFMADASHELRSPVSVIRTAAEVALSRDHREESEYRETLAMTGAQSRRLGRLVDDMLVLARADAGGYPLRPVDLYLDDVVDECRRAIAVVASDRHIMVTSAGTAGRPIRGDEALLQRLLVNLLQNAVQHTPASGAVSVAVTWHHSEVRIRVSDAGAGIPDRDRARIFDRFVQLDPSRRAGGAGLGLTIARWIAEAHGGSLQLESSGPQGSTFCVSLPCVADVR